MMWYVGCYTEDPEDDSPKPGKELGGYWEGVSERRCNKGRTGDHMLTHFNKICVTLVT